MEGYFVELQDYGRVIYRARRLVLASILLAVIAAAAVSIFAPATYIATTQLYVSVPTAAGASVGELTQAQAYARQAVPSYIGVINTAVVLDKVIADLNLEETADELSSAVTASSSLNQVLISISVSDRDPQRAAAIANSVGDNFRRVVASQLEKPEDGGMSAVKVETIQHASVPVSPDNPNIPLNIALGLLIGIGIGIGIAVLRDNLDTRVRSLDDIVLVADTPVLGGIAMQSESDGPTLVVDADPANPRAEAFRSLAMNLQSLQLGGTSRSFVVTSSILGEGKSTTAANLAVALEETGARVALVDGDLRSPRLAEYLELTGRIGLTDVLTGQSKLADALQRWRESNLYVLTHGAVPIDPSELIGSSELVRLLSTLTEHFDVVLVDSPPLLLATDAAALSKLCDGALLVVASGHPKRRELVGALRALELAGSRLLGVVVTMIPAAGPESFGFDRFNYGSTHLLGDARSPKGKNLGGHRHSRFPRWNA